MMRDDAQRCIDFNCDESGRGRRHAFERVDAQRTPAANANSAFNIGTAPALEISYRGVTRKLVIYKSNPTSYARSTVHFPSFCLGLSSLPDGFFQLFFLKFDQLSRVSISFFVWIFPGNIYRFSSKKSCDEFSKMIKLVVNVKRSKRKNWYFEKIRIYKFNLQIVDLLLMEWRKKIRGNLIFPGVRKKVKMNRSENFLTFPILSSKIFVSRETRFDGELINKTKQSDASQVLKMAW